MLGTHGFDLWAGGYDQLVGINMDTEAYPMAGYRQVLGEIYGILRSTQARTVLDISCGTGILGAKLCAAGVKVTGIEYSVELLRLARERMPEAHLIQRDIAKGLPDVLLSRSYDAVICTYAMHRLSDDEKIALLSQMRQCLRPGGRILIGGISFETAEQRRLCREKSDNWDDCENYAAMDEMKDRMIGTAYSYRQISDCAGLLEIVI